MKVCRAKVKFQFGVAFASVDRGCNGTTHGKHGGDGGGGDGGSSDG